MSDRAGNPITRRYIRLRITGDEKTYDRGRRREDGHPCDDAKRSLRSNEQLFEIISYVNISINKANMRIHCIFRQESLHDLTYQYYLSGAWKAQT